jgi:hypothetical protein
MDENTKFAVIEEGHVYSLHGVEKGAEGAQGLVFIKKEVDDTTNVLVTAHDGTTNEAVLEVLIDRLTFLNRRVPSEHNETAIDRLNDALRALRARTEDRVERGVEGSDRV